MQVYTPAPTATSNPSSKKSQDSSKRKSEGRDGKMSDSPVHPPRSALSGGEARIARCDAYPRCLVRECDSSAG